MTIAAALIPDAYKIITAIILARQNPTWTPEETASHVLNGTTQADDAFKAYLAQAAIDQASPDATKAP